MCYRLRRMYQACGHDLEKIVRCALPYYWLINRVDSVDIPGEPAEVFDRKDPGADNPVPAPYFGCFDCLDEFEERYRIGCPDCTGQGSVHSTNDLISRVGVKNGKNDNPAAYELMKNNYHRYLIDFMQQWPRHQAFFNQVTMEWYKRSDDGEDNDPDTEIPDNALYQRIILEQGPDMWSGPETFLLNSMDKVLPELKCRIETTHPPPDRYLEWDEKETHLSEHIPVLNNVATALRRRMAQDLEWSYRNWLKMILVPQDAADYDEDEDQSDLYDSQPFIQEVYGYQGYQSGFRSENIVGPRSARGPYDILEYVPQLSRRVVTHRMDEMKAALIREMTQMEIFAGRGDESLFGERTRDEYERNEHFIDTTLDFIFQLLAFDSGLTGDRMLEIARLCFSVILEPWYSVYGHSGRDPFVEPQGHEAANLELRHAIIELDESAEKIIQPDKRQSYVNRFWQRMSYDAVMSMDTINNTPDLSYLTAHWSASNHWYPFYSAWLQILANVELSHTKLTQDQLDATGDTFCPICADDYQVGHDYNCPVWYGCSNNHVLCKKCYTTLSLTPTRPYNQLRTDKSCPTCRDPITYREAMNINLLGRMRFMPTLDVELSTDVVGR